VQRQSTTQLVEQGTRSGVSVTGAVPNVDDREPLGEVNLIHQTHPISDFDIVSNVHANPKDPQPVLKALFGGQDVCNIRDFLLTSVAPSSLKPYLLWLPLLRPFSWLIWL
jgi:hypothetical protein